MLNNASRDDDDVDDDGVSSNIPNFNDDDRATAASRRTVIKSAKLSSDYERVHWVLCPPRNDYANVALHTRRRLVTRIISLLSPTGDW